MQPCEPALCKQDQTNLPTLVQIPLQKGYEVEDSTMQIRLHQPRVQVGVFLCQIPLRFLKSGLTQSHFGFDSWQRCQRGVSRGSSFPRLGQQCEWETSWTVVPEMLPSAPTRFGTDHPGPQSVCFESEKWTSNPTLDTRESSLSLRSAEQPPPMEETWFQLTNCKHTATALASPQVCSSTKWGSLYLTHSPSIWKFI